MLSELSLTIVMLMRGLASFMSSLAELSIVEAHASAANVIAEPSPKSKTRFATPKTIITAAKSCFAKILIPTSILLPFHEEAQLKVKGAPRPKDCL